MVCFLYTRQAVVYIADEAVVSVDAGVDDEIAAARADARSVVAVEGMTLLRPQPQQLPTLWTLLGRMSRHILEFIKMIVGALSSMFSGVPFTVGNCLETQITSALETVRPPLDLICMYANVNATATATATADSNHTYYYQSNHPGG